MKLLGWMHRKFRQNSGEGFREFATGPTCNCLSGRPSLDAVAPAKAYRPIFSSFEPPPEDPTAEDGVLFGGLLSIGTLGLTAATVNEEEEAPPAAAAAAAVAAEVEAIAKKEAEETTETDLETVTLQLEKALAAEAEKAGDRLSSARPSHASAKPSDAAACPLQGFLFGAAVEVAVEAKEGERKEKRASLGELFLRSKMVEEANEEEERPVMDGGEGRSSAGVKLVRMLKRGGSTGGGGGGCSRSCGGGSAAAENKFHKILQLFHRKVHPENAITPKKARKFGKYENRAANPPSNGGDESVGSWGEPLMRGSKRSFRKESIESSNCYLNAPSLTVSDSDSNREYWIKTDADYLVLEL